jgi:hypothetical protein
MSTALPAASGCPRWQRHFKGVLKQRSRLEVPAVFEREGEQYNIEPSCAQILDEPRRQVLDEIKPEGRIAATQPGQNIGQQEWADGLDHSHPQSSAERLASGERLRRDLSPH